MRVAVGASRSAIIRLFLKERMRLVVIGLAGGLFGLFWAVKILEGFVFGIQPSGLATRIVACRLMMGVGLIAVWWPARRAAARDPVVVLKEG